MPIHHICKSFILNALHFLKVPELDLPTQAIEEFERIYRTYIEKENGDLIEYTSSYPKYLFLNYMIENKDVLVHGSNNKNIEIFEPKKQSLFTGKPVKAVFAASDGIWSMFFAVINRSEYVGSLRNACFTLQTKKGIKRFYYFSVNEECKGELWNDGCIYIMPKNVFKQGGIKDEWICENKVKPLAKLSVTPKDFPFLEKVKRHKETDSMLKTIVKALIFNC
jgi:hypothetical protein